MASNTQQNKSSQKKKGDKNSNPQNKTWPNLPDQLIRTISKESTFSPTDVQVDKEWSLMHSISSSAVTKSWRTHSNKSGHSTAAPPGPRLQLHNSAVGFHPIRLNPKIGRGYWNWGGRWKTPDDTLILDFLGCSCGWFVRKSVSYPEKEEMILWDPFMQMSCFLPEWSPLHPISFAALSSSCRFPRKKSPIVIVLTGISRPAFAFYAMDRGNEHSWRRTDCEIVDPNSPCGGLMKFSNGIWFEGKFYALSTEGTLAVMEEEVGSSVVRITQLGKRRAVPDSAGLVKFTECLVESDGKVFLVFLVWGKSSKVVEEVEVYKLDVRKLWWVRVRSLGGAALFLRPDCCVSVPAEKLSKCRGNCVYFVSGECGGERWVHDVESGVISSCGRDFDARTDLFCPGPEFV